MDTSAGHNLSAAQRALLSSFAEEDALSSPVSSLDLDAELLARYVRDEASAIEREVVEAAMEMDPDTFAEVEELRETLASLPQKYSFQESLDRHGAGVSPDDLTGMRSLSSYFALSDADLVGADLPADLLVRYHTEQTTTIEREVVEAACEFDSNVRQELAELKRTEEYVNHLSKEQKGARPPVPTVWASLLGWFQSRTVVGLSSAVAAAAITVVVLQSRLPQEKPGVIVGNVPTPMPVSPDAELRLVEALNARYQRELLAVQRAQEQAAKNLKQKESETVRLRTLAANQSQQRERMERKNETLLRQLDRLKNGDGKDAPASSGAALRIAPAVWLAAANASPLAGDDLTTGAGKSKSVTLGNNSPQKIQTISLISPVATRLLTTNPRLYWMPIPGAVRYLIRVTNVVTRKDITNPYPALEGADSTRPLDWRVTTPLESGAVYEWTVEAQNEAGELIAASDRILVKTLSANEARAIAPALDAPFAERIKRFMGAGLLAEAEADLTDYVAVRRDPKAQELLNALRDRIRKSSLPPP